MITVYFEEVDDFSEKSFNAAKAEITQVGQREILTVKNSYDDAVAQFDMNTVIGWINSSYDITATEAKDDN